MRVPWPEGERFGPSMLPHHVGLLTSHGAPLLRAVGRSDLPETARPPIEAVRAAVAAWPATEGVPRKLPAHPVSFGWDADALIDAWLRRLIDADGRPAFVRPKRGKWAEPIGSGGTLYRSQRSGKRCCGVALVASHGTQRKVGCPVCGAKHWNAELRGT